MTDTGADVVLVDMVEEYLLAQDTKLMIDCLHIDNNSYRLLAEATDRLRWDSFLEGRISTVWLDVMKPQLMDGNTYLSPQRWGRQLIEQLLQITHKQWIFRNSRLYYKKLDGLTALEHHKIFEKMEELMHTDPDELLPRHRHLLEENFGALGEGSSIDRQYWIASMESALSAASCVQKGRVTPGSMPNFNRPRRPRNRPTVRSNGTILYRPRCR